MSHSPINYVSEHWPPDPPELQPTAIQRYQIKHTTRFAYSSPVQLDQMVLRLQPRTGVHQRLVNFTILSDPQPAKQTNCIDLHGNIRHWFWYDRQHDQLIITTRSVVDCYKEDPFDFIIVDPGVLCVPAKYSEPVRSAAAHYRHRPNPSLQVDALAEKLLKESGGSTLSFLSVLNLHLHANVHYISRPSGDPWEPADTLARGEGSCRDTAVLFMDVCRSVGLAARFVSGYAWDAEEPTNRELHAWAEVYLPGGGWCGYDPTVGLAVSNRHVPVAASPTPSYAAPTAGTFTGPPVETALEYHITMTRTELPCEPVPSGATHHWA